MMWFGGAIIGGFFLQPTAKALGTAGQPFMDHLMKRRGMGIFFPIVAALAIISGAALYWHDSGGLQAAWITSPTGLAYTIGGLAALVAFVGGLVLIAPSIAEQAAVQSELANGDGVLTADQDRRLARAGADAAFEPARPAAAPPRRTDDGGWPVSLLSGNAQHDTGPCGDLRRAGHRLGRRHPGRPSVPPRAR